MDSFRSQGFALLNKPVKQLVVDELLTACERVFADRDLAEKRDGGVLAKSSRGHVYAARNLIRTLPMVATVWRTESLIGFLKSQLGDRFGLVRALFFDKPPDRTWALGWHKDTAIAVADNGADRETPSPFFSRPTVKAGVPHVIASDEILRQMLTLRIHLDEVTDENGPLRVVPQSHHTSDSEGVGVQHAVSVHAAKGQVLAMRPLLTHGSGSSLPGTDRHRRILHLEFAASKTLPDGYRWHDFIPFE
ncbi:phytanoyl-CoA dioxygenase [Rhodopirellula sp. MGV]|nr:phytanoyl-CoA dioxygenase [Rhodopirellula sp. MGV]PNY36689.1 phytanoyl-CoA dioxygenase [Rhodopirellula baltica]